MIIPFPKNFTSWSLYPVTFTILLLNVVLFLMLNSRQQWMESEPLFLEDQVLLTGRLYYQYLQHLPLSAKKEDLSETQVPNWLYQVNTSSKENFAALGGAALRDRMFLSSASQLKFQGDLVAIEKWRENLRLYLKHRKSALFTHFGLVSMEQGPFAWITYQFVHSGLTHLLFNMVFLLFLGAAVEGLAGGSALILVYILGGIIGGGTFLLFKSHGVVPVVGASSSISALLTFYLFFESRKRIRYFYFFSPRPQHHGVIYLPKYWIVPLFVLSDLTQVFTMTVGLGGVVAHTAHLGGFIAGILLAQYEHFFKSRLSTDF